MIRYAGKARIGVIAILGAAALAIAGLHRSSGPAYGGNPTPTLFVTDVCSDAVTAYSAASSGDVSPLAPAPRAFPARNLWPLTQMGTFTPPTTAPLPSLFTPRGAMATPHPPPSSPGARPS